MVDRDLLKNAKDLLRLASNALDHGRFGVAKDLTVLAAQYLDAEMTEADRQSMGREPVATDPTTT